MRHTRADWLVELHLSPSRFGACAQRTIVIDVSAYRYVVCARNRSRGWKRRSAVFGTGVPFGATEARLGNGAMIGHAQAVRGHLQSECAGVGRFCLICPV